MVFNCAKETNEIAALTAFVRNDNFLEYIDEVGVSNDPVEYSMECIMECLMECIMECINHVNAPLQKGTAVTP